MNFGLSPNGRPASRRSATRRWLELAALHATHAGVRAALLQEREQRQAAGAAQRRLQAGGPLGEWGELGEKSRRVCDTPPAANPLHKHVFRAPLVPNYVPTGNTADPKQAVWGPKGSSVNCEEEAHMNCELQPSQGTLSWY